MIPSIAGHIARISFRFGLVVDQVCRSLEISQDEINANGAWVYCVHGMGEQDARDAVNQFNENKAYASTSRASVFNVDNAGSSVSIGGPPSTLKALFAECDGFKNTTNVAMRKIQGMWHTDNVYGAEHVRQVLPMIESTRELYIPLISPVSGEPFRKTEAGPLLEQIMEEILTERVRWDMVIDVVTNQLKQLMPESAQLVSILPSHYNQNMVERWQIELPKAAVSDLAMTPAVLDLVLGNCPPKDTKSSKIAVVGMACRFPGADTTEELWERLMQGQDMHRHVPPDRFDVQTHVDPTGKAHNTSKTSYGCFVDNPGQFEAMFFGMSPREAEQTDPMQRLALVTAYEALENAGYVDGRGVTHRQRVGTFYGQASDDYREVNSGQEVGTYFIPGGCRAFGPGRINYFLNFWGPSFSVDTACSSSLAAIQAACSSLWSGDVDMAITGGMNILTNSDVYAGLSQGHFLSPTGGCKTWDEGADGYCRSDGVGSVVLKRLEDAEADNDNVIAVVLSAATSHSAEAVSITHPHDAAQALLYNQIVRRAGIDPLEVGYVEMHGTGTQAGDPTEMRSVTSVFAPSRLRGNRPIPLHVGSVKANMGHGEAAAGIMAFIKTMLVFQNGIIPPHIGVKTGLNPALPDLDNMGVVIPFKAANWGPAGTHRRLAMVNNFGAAGGNTAMIIEEASTRPRAFKDAREFHAITVSAKTAQSLSLNIKRLVEYIEVSQDLSVADVAYTLSARRRHYAYRKSVIVKSLAEAVKQLQPHVETAIAQTPTLVKQPPVAFVFGGQGTFYVGIAAEIYRDSPFFRGQLDQFDSLARRQNFPSFLPAIDRMSVREDLPASTVHLAIVCAEIALARLCITFGIKPCAVIGHSLGEYAALAVAGVLSDSDTVFLVGTRAAILESNCSSYTHGMVSVRASVADIAREADGLPFEVACINGPNETVIGGTIQNLDACSARLSKAGFRTTRVDVPHAYHTAQMDNVVNDLSRQTQDVVYNAPRIPIISPRDSNVIETGANIDSSYLTTSLRKTVDFAGALNVACEAGVVSKSTVWVELGPHPVCNGFISRTLAETRLTCSPLRRDSESWTSLVKMLNSLYEIGLNIDWNEYHRPFEHALRLVSVPTYAWNNKNYWIQYRGDWNLTKGLALPEPASPVARGFRTSSIQRLYSENYDLLTGQVLGECNMTDASLKEIINGHAMNGYGVASSFLHADMAFTLAQRVQEKAFSSKFSGMGINVANFEYHDPVVPDSSSLDPHPILVQAEANAEKGEVRIKWFNPANDKWYCHATAFYEDASAWLSNWVRTTKLVTSRIDALNLMSLDGTASKLTTDLAYALFGKLVDYSNTYRTMQWVILNEDEAVAEVIFPADTQGDWAVPPHFIDGLVSLSGFILNGGTHFDNTSNFFITPSWKSMRFAKPLVPGDRYLAYVRMVPEANENNGKLGSYVGDVYILQDSQIVGVVEAILFRQWPRVMLNRFFRPANAAAPTPATKTKPSGPIPVPSTSFLQERAMAMVMAANMNGGHAASASTPPTSGPINQSVDLPKTMPHSNYNLLPPRGAPPPNELVEKTDSDSGYEEAVDTDDAASRALNILAEELAVDIGLLTDECEIADIGLDSLMSLVISQKLRENIGIEIRDAFYLEVTTIGDLKKLVS
ncbi:Acyl transferase/acyl hydrolase/lysophospholipase [Penicillium coprophilum]|uniref:Acyl transferase/acyl hydrolase/lysophospholipase n=1 Tax=Penicillium coprophilum TaxID=36646 RepID=UPI0023A2536A|nr:Acyl transferase/acyl hydrolase/lysophospholipase [Penicillium coprophilum]KAJ5165076.1 Acyl transferase/acyl hydrolase/lysophospholipase [Penicillium coprophilum]